MECEFFGYLGYRPGADGGVKPPPSPHDINAASAFAQAAVVWGAHRFATNVQIWNVLVFTADNLGPPNWDQEYGYGRLDVAQAAVMLVPAPAMALKP